MQETKQMEIITLNGVNFRINENDELMAFKENNKTKLQKERQNLYSWNWFYMNSKENLFATRYHKSNIIKNNEEMSVDVYVNDSLNSNYGKVVSYSQRAKEDREKVAKLNIEIQENWEKSTNK